MGNDQWPFNGKSLWASLQPGQKFAVIIGVPMFHLMMRAYMGLVEWVIPFRGIQVLFFFIGLFVIPWVYVRGIGIFIAVLFQILISMKRFWFLALLFLAMSCTRKRLPEKQINLCPHDTIRSTSMYCPGLKCNTCQCLNCGLIWPCD